MVFRWESSRESLSRDEGPSRDQDSDQEPNEREWSLECNESELPRIPIKSGEEYREGMRVIKELVGWTL